MLYGDPLADLQNSRHPNAPAETIFCNLLRGIIRYALKYGWCAKSCMYASKPQEMWQYTILVVMQDFVHEVCRIGLPAKALNSSVV